MDIDSSLLKLANDVRSKYGVVAYSEFSEQAVKVLLKDSFDEYRTIQSEEELSDISLYSSGRAGIDLVDPKVLSFVSEPISDTDQDISEANVLLSLFCDEISRECSIPAFVEDGSIHLFGKEAESREEVISILAYKVEEEEFNGRRLDEAMLRLANSLRKDYGMVAYVIPEKDRSVVSVKVTDREKDVEIITERPENIDVSQYLIRQKGSTTAVEHMDIFLPFLDSCFPNNKVDDLSLMLFCDKISIYLKLGEIYLDNHNIIALGKKFKKKDTLIKELPALIKSSSDTGVRNPLQELAELAYNSDFVQEGKAVVLDGVAYIADSYLTYNSKAGSYYIEGFVQEGKVVWVKVDKTKFKAWAVEEADQNNKSEIREIYLLETLYYSDLYIVYRSVLKNELKKVVKSPYPVAILEDGVYAFYFEAKSEEEESSWKKKWKSISKKWED